MRAIKEVRHFIEKSPDTESAKTLARLVLALENEASFDITDIYKLSMDQFQLALKILREWRLDRYSAGKARLFDTALQAAALDGSAVPAVSSAAP
jgi:hypothetical protein